MILFTILYILCIIILSTNHLLCTFDNIVYSVHNHMSTNHPLCTFKASEDPTLNIARCGFVYSTIKKTTINCLHCSTRSILMHEQEISHFLHKAHLITIFRSQCWTFESLHLILASNPCVTGWGFLAWQTKHLQHIIRRQSGARWEHKRFLANSLWLWCSLGTGNCVFLYVYLY